MSVPASGFSSYLDDECATVDVMLPESSPTESLERVDEVAYHLRQVLTVLDSKGEVFEVVSLNERCFGDESGESESDPFQPRAGTYRAEPVAAVDRNIYMVTAVCAADPPVLMIHSDLSRCSRGTTSKQLTSWT